jgi:tRNA-dihydrouridine synthase
VPVTIKMRMGIDEDHLTYRQAGLIAQEAGVKAVALHARTAAQRYSGTAHWDAIADLVSVLDVPVLGNGDIWEADDALRMVSRTGCAGVVVGRGCLGRPWLFADLAAAFAGSPHRVMPALGEVAAVMRRHAALLVAWAGRGSSPTCRPRSPPAPATARCCPPSARWRRSWPGTPTCWSTRSPTSDTAAPTSASTSPGI